MRACKIRNDNCNNEREIIKTYAQPCRGEGLFYTNGLHYKVADECGGNP